MIVSGMLRMELQTLDALKSTKGDEVLLHYPVPCQKRHSRQVRPSSCSAVWLPTPDQGTLRPAPSPFTVLSDLLIIATPPTNKGRIVPGQLNDAYLAKQDNRQWRRLRSWSKQRIQLVQCLQPINATPSTPKPCSEYQGGR